MSDASNPKSLNLAASAPLHLPLARSAVDRDGARREEPDLLARLWADDATRVLVLHRRRALLAVSNGADAEVRDAQPRLALLTVADVPADTPHLYLGRTREASADGPEGTAIVAVLADDALAARLAGDDLANDSSAIADTDRAHNIPTADDRWGDLRLLGAKFDARDAGLFTQALAMANWHQASGYSPRTGAPTVSSRAGWVRHPEGAEEESSGEHVFPRTDPAVIVGVVDQHDRLLLASNVAWDKDRYSVLAGFVEPGESFEATVEREVLEESGLHVVDPRYVGSQPWPFPASVMVGFIARTDPTKPVEAVPDAVEIREVRWFTRDELAAALLSGAPRPVRLPGRTSIARAIIEHWYGGELPGEW